MLPDMGNYFICFTSAGQESVSGTSRAGGKGGVLVYVSKNSSYDQTVAKGVFAESHLCSRLGPAWETDSSHITEQSLLHT